MLKFQVFEDGRFARPWRVRNAYLVGSDHSAMRADIAYADGMLICQKREGGAAALALQQPVGDCGEITIQTTLLPEREEPYLLSLEQARHRLTLILAKQEEWGLYDLGEDHPVSKRIERSRKLFIEALCLHKTDMAAADRVAKECLSAAIDASEELALAHAELLLNRRKQVNSLPRYPIGCGVALEQTNERIRAAVVSNFDILAMPMPWRSLAPAEGEYRWDLVDNWAEWAQKCRMPIIAGPVVCFDPSVLPDWVYIWEHDYETVRDLLYEHTERVVNRYKNSVNIWNVVSGLHVNNHFTFNFDQLMELTRMCAMLVKKIQPTAKVLVEIRQPFGEYFSSNTRSIPPMMYADLLIQGAVNMDGFAIKMLMGQALPGQFTRDLMQISTMLDQFSLFGKPLYITLASPSEPVTSMMLPAVNPNEPVDPDCGYWRKPWSQLVQSRWLEAVYYVTLSKPYVETVIWHEMVDHPYAELPLAGLVSEDLQPKTAFRRMVGFRRSLLTKSPSVLGGASNGQLSGSAGASGAAGSSGGAGNPASSTPANPAGNQLAGNNSAPTN